MPSQLSQTRHLPKYISSTIKYQMSEPRLGTYPASVLPNAIYRVDHSTTTLMLWHLSQSWPTQGTEVIGEGMPFQLYELTTACQETQHQCLC